jgi:hypothetical protein
LISGFLKFKILKELIYILFRPLEAKEYSVDLPIKISDIEGPSPHSNMLKLRGTGYHPE